MILVASVITDLLVCVRLSVFLVICAFVQHAFFKRDENDIGPYSWNITGTYKGNFCSILFFCDGYATLVFLCFPFS
jgi:hypothetical protein